MRTTAIWTAAIAALCLSFSLAMAEEATDGYPGEVTLRDGTTISCERLAVGHNYSLCFQSNPQFLTVNHAEVSSMRFDSPHPDAIKIVRLR